MIITNLIIDKISTKRDLKAGQVWLDTTTNIPYFLTWTWRNAEPNYTLVNMSSGAGVNETTNINNLFGDFDKDYVQVDTELVIRGRI